MKDYAQPLAFTPMPNNCITNSNNLKPNTTLDSININENDNQNINKKTNTENIKQDLKALGISNDE